MTKTESIKQSVPLSTQMIDIQFVSQNPLSPIFIICTEARTFTSGTTDKAVKSVAEFTQFLQSKRPDDIRYMQAPIKVLWSPI